MKTLLSQPPSNNNVGIIGMNHTRQLSSPVFKEFNLKLGQVEHAVNSSTLEAEARGFL